MNTNEELTPKEKQPTEQAASDREESKELPKKKRVHGPMQLRVFEKMGMRLRLNVNKSDTERED